MENAYEEKYPKTVSYDKYKRDTEEYKEQIENLQNEIYKRDRIKEAFEYFIEDLKINYEKLQSDLKKEYERREK